MPAVVESMMYAGATPWHGLGTYVGDQAVTSEEAIRASGLDWHVEKWPLYAAAPEDTVLEQLSLVDRQYAMVRDTDKSVLGIVGERYQIVQNRDAFDFLDEVAGTNLRYNTAGSLKDGRLIWLLAELDGEVFEPIDGDPVKPYLLFSNTHDGSGAVRTFLTNTRVVCCNTYNMALRSDGKGKRAVSIRHTGDIKQKIKSAQEILGLAVKQSQLMSEAFSHLASIRIDGRRFEGLLDQVAPLPELDPETQEFVTSPTKSQNIRDQITELFEGGLGSDIPGVRGTAWAAFNAVTEFTNHHRGTRGAGDDLQKERSKRLESVWFGSGAQLNDKAFTYLMAA